MVGMAATLRSWSCPRIYSCQRRAPAVVRSVKEIREADATGAIGFVADASSHDATRRETGIRISARDSYAGAEIQREIKIEIRREGETGRQARMAHYDCIETR